MATPRKTPTRAVKAVAPGEYKFTVDGKVHSLPPASACAPHVPAGTLMDAVLDGGDTAQLKLGLAMLTAKDDDGKTLVDAASLTALRKLSMVKFAEILNAWMGESGATPGESVSSSS